MTTAYLLALDQGTSSSRSIVFDAGGRIVAMAQREFTQHFPQPGWVEHDADEIWATQLATAREALQRAGIGADRLAAVGITNQRETTVLWDRATGRPIHRAIVWQDRRTAPLCATLREQGLADTVRSRTGLVIDAYFSATKIRWLLDNVPGARAAAARGALAFGTIDTWLAWQLSGGRLHVTDVTNASRTMLYDIGRHAWDATLLDALDIPASLLPEVVPSSHVVGRTAAGVLGAEVPIGGMAGDQQAALFGQACFTPGLAKNTYGTGCFLLMHTGARCPTSTHGLVTTAAAQIRAPVGAQPAYALEGSVFVGGAVVQWMRDGLHAVQQSAQIEALAASVPDAGGVHVVPAFTGLGAPWWQPDARGAILGLTRGSTIAHIARAALESIAFQSAALLEAMTADLAAEAVDGAASAGAPPTASVTHGRTLPAPQPPAAAGSATGPVTELRVDGGACVNDLLMQFQADLLGIPVVRPRVTETTALGAAYLAGLATGVWPDTAALASQWEVERRFHPTLDRAQARARMDAWLHAVRQTLA